VVFEVEIRKAEEKGGRDSEHLIVPWKLGNPPQGTQWREGDAVSWSLWRER